jgi:hypothetical protein
VKMENMFSAKIQNWILTAIIAIDVIGIICVCCINKGIILGY